jgi:hypothetical protein
MTHNERQQLPKLSQQMVSFRLWLTEQDPQHNVLAAKNRDDRKMHALSHLPLAATVLQLEACNVFWNELHGLQSPMAPASVSICPQQEELFQSKQLVVTMSLELRTVVPPADRRV